MDPKHTEALVIGGGALLVVGALFFASRSTTTGGQTATGPSDSAVASIEAANANATASANSLSAAKTNSAAQTILGLASLAAGQNIAGINSAAATTQVEATTQAAVQENATQATATVDADSILAKANEVIQQYVSAASNYNETIAGKAQVASAQATAGAAASVGVANANAVTTEANDALNASNTKAADGIWQSVIGGISSAIPFFSGGGVSSPPAFSFPVNTAPLSEPKLPVQTISTLNAPPLTDLIP